MKILITGANGDIAISIFKIIKNSFKKANVYGSDTNLRGKGMFYFKKIYAIPSASNAKYLKCAIKLYKQFDLIIPVTENEIDIISKNISKFYNIKFLINSSKIIMNFLDKLKTYEYLKKHNLNNVKFCDKLENYKKYKFPMFVKKRFGSGNKNYFVFKKVGDLKKNEITNKKDFIIQEYIPNKREYTSAIYRNKNFINVIILERLLDKDKTFYAKSVKIKLIEEKLKLLAKKIDLEGSINVQFKLVNNNIKIFEINPRLSSTVRMRHIMGFKDCLWWMVDTMKLKKKKTKFIFNKSKELILEETIKNHG